MRPSINQPQRSTPQLPLPLTAAPSIPLDEPTRAALVRLLASLLTSACASAAGREERDETR